VDCAWRPGPEEEEEEEEEEAPASSRIVKVRFSDDESAIK
jgi:hypothetical protein